MLNWIFLKKLLFTTTITFSTTVPVYLIYRQHSSGYEETISEYKKLLKGNYLASSGSYTNNTNLDKFAKYLLKSEDLQHEIAPVIIKELLHSWLIQKENKRYKELEKKEEQNYQDELMDQRARSSVNAEQKVFDRYGGTRKIMRKRWISEKIYSELRSEVKEFSHRNFTINLKNTSSSTDWKKDKNAHFISKDHFLAESEINNTSNWSKISWYPIFTENIKEDESLQEFEIKKFNLINYAYKLWFLDHQPFNVHAALWKYDAKGENLKNLYSENVLKEHNISLPSYAFPSFSDETDGKEISKLEKFSQFVKKYGNGSSASNGSGSTSEDNIFYLPLNFTDDSSTLIYVEGKNMYEKLFTEFAAASNYMYAKLLEKNGTTGNGDCFLKESTQAQKQKRSNSQSTKINVISNLSSKTLDDLFLEKNDSGSSGSSSSEHKRSIPIDKTIFAEKDSKKDNKELSYDMRELDNESWIFIRNEAGIHALKVDGMEYTKKGNGCKLKKAFEVFNFRTLQSANKVKLNISKTFSENSEKQLESFKKFLDQNFEYILLKYWIDNSDSNNFFSGVTLNDQENLKKLLTQSQKIIRYKEKVKKVINLREKILEKYSKRKYELDGSKKLKSSHKSEGLSGALPWTIQISLAENKLFPELEKIYELNSEGEIKNSSEVQAHSSEGGSSSNSPSEIEKMYEEYYSSIDKYVSSMRLAINPDYPFLNSDRLFTNNDLIDQWTDLFLKKSDLLNEYLVDRYFLDSHVNKESVKEKIESSTDQRSEKIFISLKGDQDTEEEFKEEETENGDWFKKKTEKKELFKNLGKFVKAYYYKNKYLPKNNNFWNILKKGTWNEETEEAGQQEESNPSSDFKGKFKKIFKEEFYLNSENERKKYQKFLITLLYLIENDFSNFLELLKKNITNESKAFLAWKKPKTSKSFDFSNFFNNPWIKNSIDKEKTTFEEGHLEKFEALLSSQHKKLGNGEQEQEASQVQTNGKYIFKDLLIFSDGLSSSWNNWLNLEKVPEKVFRYATREELIQEINKIEKEIDLSRIVAHLKQNIPNIDLSAVNAESLYINGKVEKTLRNLTLTEKKNALLALVNNYKVPQKLSSGISKEEYKRIYLLDSDKNFASSGWKHTLQQSEEEKRKKRSASEKKSFYQENVKEDVFKRYEEFFSEKEKDKESGKENFLLQIRVSDISSFEKFKEFLKNLNEDIFWEWIINTASREDVQAIALQDIEKYILKMEVYDSQWKSNLKEEFIY